MAEFLRRSQRKSRIEVHDLENKDKDRQIGPIGYEGSEINGMNVIEINQKKSRSEG
jgi:hypothetical protein